MADEIDECSRTEIGTGSGKSERQSAASAGGLDNPYGLTLLEGEPKEEFRKRVVARIDRGGFRESCINHSWELNRFLRDHFFRHICWWRFSNDGRDFAIELTETDDALFPCVQIRVYPSGKPKL
jgi:hypothetical protein